MMKMWRAFVALLVVSTIGCTKYSAGVPGPIGEGEDAQLAIVELVVRVVVQEHQASSPIFVSYRLPGSDQMLPATSPPSTFFARLNDLGIDILPHSEMRAWRKEMSRRIEQGEPVRSLRYGASLEIHFRKWYSSNEAKVSISINQGVMASHGFTTNVKRLDGEWRMYKTSAGWTT